MDRLVILVKVESMAIDKAGPLLNRVCCPSATITKKEEKKRKERKKREKKLMLDVLNFPSDWLRSGLCGSPEKKSSLYLVTQTSVQSLYGGNGQEVENGLYHKQRPARSLAHWTTLGCLYFGHAV